jgi:DNA-binding XRE family transcriptional regulator
LSRVYKTGLRLAIIIKKELMILTATDIRELRFSMGLTQYEFAAKVGVQPTTISRYENGAAPTKLAQLKLQDIYRKQARKNLRLKHAGVGD